MDTAICAGLLAVAVLLVVVLVVIAVRALNRAQRTADAIFREELAHPERPEREQS